MDKKKMSILTYVLKSRDFYGKKNSQTSISLKCLENIMKTGSKIEHYFIQNIEKVFKL